MGIIWMTKLSSQPIMIDVNTVGVVNEPIAEGLPPQRRGGCGLSERVVECRERIIAQMMDALGRRCRVTISIRPLSLLF